MAAVRARFMSTAIDETEPGLTLHQAAQMVEKARWAAASFATYPRQAVLAVVEAMAKAGAAESRRYADWAVKESGFGNPDHKEVKNRLCSTGLYDHYKDHNFTDFQVDPEAKTVAIPKPAGVIFALTPSTNPVCSVFYKAIIALLTRNAVVISPHPAAKVCGADAARLLARAAEQAGAPDGIVQVIADPTMPIITSIMTSDRINLILATGGSPVVRAAYSSGNPAIGVGPGNNPVYVDEIRRRRQGGEADRRFQGLRQFDPLHQQVGGDRPYRRRGAARRGNAAPRLSFDLGRRP